MFSKVVSCLLCLTISITAAFAFSESSKEILEAAQRDGIDLLAFNFTTSALKSIDNIFSANQSIPTVSNNTSHLDVRIDTHAHAVPDWYRQIVPTIAGQPTPFWSIEAEFEFMKSLNITHRVLSITTPGSTVYSGDREASVALARLLNEWQAALVRTYPKQFSFVATIPLPYTEESIVEATYSISKLNAVGIILLSNHEGFYLGNSIFQPFYQTLNSLTNERHTIFVHPHTPYLRYNGVLIEANPTIYPPRQVEFYFDTARTVMDLFLSGTVQNFTNIRYQVAHVGDSFPSVIDRFLSSSAENASDIYHTLQTRFWWDTAGPTFPHQVLGLVAYDVPKTQLTFGTDWPFRRNHEANVEAMLNAPFLNEDDLDWILAKSPRRLYDIGPL
ncbi:hypothetical protein SS1G_09143 [Sclerotinia sclerotiorum 1980 UF-70]|uniref:Amidohydrolase-related domain-containing protein n=2 Tax=Sclerotinia sclerotiorum (strain ATCC 18683 / 1980 / Ss-1) TaxID=665079 RepID=A7EUY5_SCLS1|nr:hypothetical protein SS1G_09143 [Sclerotinia sclerotiorum 1980 UF-70]APA15956.1 hypothetical protein sscle_15g107260 [Sclerotinia sclerotiorum 1980 UF-70]EDN93277.1 hypothetical protein SS1G_09143 [Sclerotinia sclerotiorum 1980 UF-70]